MTENGGRRRNSPLEGFTKSCKVGYGGTGIEHVSPAIQAEVLTKANIHPSHTDIYWQLLEDTGSYYLDQGGNVSLICYKKVVVIEIL